MHRKIPLSSQQNGVAIKGGHMNFFKDQDPLHTIKTEFNLQPDGDLNNLLQSSQFLAGSNQLQEMSKSGNRTAQNMSRKRRINH